LVLTQPVCKLWVLISFRVNHEYIATFLCEKREEPENECNGKCWLKKELGTTEQKNPYQTPPPKTEISGDNYICQGEDCKLKDYSADKSHSYGCYKNKNYNSGMVADIFHPPKLKAT